jgi:class 3 adenylate cyclase
MKRFSSLFFIIYFVLFTSWAFGFQVDRKQLYKKAQKIDEYLVRALKANNFREAVKFAKQNGEIYISLEKPTIAEKYYKNAISYAIKADDKKLLAYAYELEGDFFSPKTAFKKKIKSYESAEQLYYEVNSIDGVAVLKKKIAKYAFEQKQYELSANNSKLLLDSAEVFGINDFEKLNHCKVLIVAFSKLNKPQELKKYMNILGGINNQSVNQSKHNEETDFDVAILREEFTGVMANATIELQQIVQKQQDSLTSTSTELALKREESAMQQDKLQAQDSLSKTQKQIIAQQQELVRLQEVESQRLYIGIISSFVIIALTVFALIGRQIANRRLERQKKEIEEQKKLIEIERKKSEELLLNILPHEVATELKEKGMARPRSYNMVTVLFTDFKGFTAISEKLSPEQIVDKLNFFFQKFDEIAEKYNLEKIKTLGDGYMCAGGIPIENNTNPVDAVRAGLEMQAFMTDWNNNQDKKGLPTFGLRLGINTGPLVAGVIGKNKFAYDVWGDTVNLASRMESSGEVGKVNISGITHTWVKHHFECVYRGKIEAKNKGEVDMFFVEREIIR